VTASVSLQDRPRRAADKPFIYIFPGGSQAAIDSLTDVFSDHLMNLGRTMRSYVDNHSRSMTAEEIILHTLFENGTTELSQLDSYIRDDVEAYGAKLSDLSTRMQKAFMESVELPRVVEDESVFRGEKQVFAK
jgi:transcriptional activator SPT7